MDLDTVEAARESDIGALPRPVGRLQLMEVESESDDPLRAMTPELRTYPSGTLAEVRAAGDVNYHAIYDERQVSKSTEDADGPRAVNSNMKEQQEEDIRADRGVEIEGTGGTSEAVVPEIKSMTTSMPKGEAEAPTKALFVSDAKISPSEVKASALEMKDDEKEGRPKDTVGAVDESAAAAEVDATAGLEEEEASKVAEETASGRADGAESAALLPAGETTDQWWKSLALGIEVYAEGDEGTAAKQGIGEEGGNTSQERIKRYEDEIAVLLQQQAAAKAVPREERDITLLKKLKRDIKELKEKLADAVKASHPKEREEMEADFRKRREKLLEAFDEAEKAENYEALEQIQKELIGFTFARYVDERIGRKKKVSGKEKKSKEEKDRGASTEDREKEKKKKKKSKKSKKSEGDVHYV